MRVFECRKCECGDVDVKYQDGSEVKLTVKPWLACRCTRCKATWNEQTSDQGESNSQSIDKVQTLPAR